MDIRKFFNVTAKAKVDPCKSNRKNPLQKADVTSIPMGVSPSAKVSPRHTNRKVVTRTRKTKNESVRKAGDGIPLVNLFAKTQSTKGVKSVASTPDMFDIPLSQRIQTRNLGTMTQAATPKKEEMEKRGSSWKVTEHPMFTISLSDSLKEDFSSSLHGAGDEGEAGQDAGASPCTPPKRKNVSHSADRDHAEGHSMLLESEERRTSGRRQLSFDMPCVRSERENLVGEFGLLAAHSQSTPLSVKIESADQRTPDEVLSDGFCSFNQSQPLFESTMSDEENTESLLHRASSVIVISDDDL